MAVVVAQVVAYRTTDREVLGLIPAGSWDFFIFFIPSKVSPQQVPHGGATILILLFKMLELKQA